MLSALRVDNVIVTRSIIPDIGEGIIQAASLKSDANVALMARDEKAALFVLADCPFMLAGNYHSLRVTPVIKHDDCCYSNSLT